MPAKGALTAPGMWPARGIDRLRLAAITLAGAGVDDQRRRIEAGHLVPGRRPIPRAAAPRTRRRRRHRAALQRPAFRLPLRDAAVEHGHRVVAVRAQQVPEAGRDGAGLVVVGHDARRGPDAGGADDRRDLLFRRPGMAPRGQPAAAARRGEVGVHVEEHGARECGRRGRRRARRSAGRGTSARPRRGDRARRSPRASQSVVTMAFIATGTFARLAPGARGPTDKPVARTAAAGTFWWLLISGCRTAVRCRPHVCFRRVTRRRRAARPTRHRPCHG